MRTILVLIFAAVCAHAQLPDSVWSRAYGVDNAHWKCVGLVRTDDGGFVLAGNQERGERESDMVLLGCGHGGDSMWAVTYNNRTNFGFGAASDLHENRYMLAGNASSQNENQVRLLSVNSWGEIDWDTLSSLVRDSIWCSDIVRSDNSNSIIYNARLNGLYLVGHYEFDDNAQQLSGSGNGYSFPRFVTSMALQFDECLVTGGYSDRGMGGSDDCELLWWGEQGIEREAQYGGPARDRCEKIIATSDGGYLLAGTTLSFGAGDQDILLIKINAQGDSLWSQTFGGVYFDDFGSVVETSFGSYLVVGTHENESDDNFDLLLGSCDANGGHRQQSFIGGAAEDVGMDLLPLDSGVVMIAGHTRSLGGDWRKLWLLRTEYRPHLSVDRGSITFGAVQLGDSVTRVLNIYNAGGVELSLDSLTFPRGYHVNVPLPLLLNPGQELPLEIIFAPQQVGAHVGNMTIYSDALEGPVQVRLVGSGQGSVVRRGDELLPARTELTSIFPNPFNAETELKFTLSAPQHTTLTIYDTQGRTVSVLLDEPLGAGFHTIHFNGRDFPSGLYIATLNTPSAHDSRKLILLR